MSDDWKPRERALNQPYMDELRGAIGVARLTVGQAADAAGFTQQQLSSWLSSKSVMSAARYVHIAQAIGADPVKLVKRATVRARDEGLLPPAP